MKSTLSLTCVFALSAAVLAGSAAAQTPAPVPTGGPAFEVASIKASNPDPSNPLSQLPLIMPQPGGRLVATNVPLRFLIMAAYELQQPNQLSGGPAALMSARFDITAKAAGGAALGQKELMPLLRNLLSDRFKLKVHNESRELPSYDLMLTRGDGRLGPDIKPSKSDCSKMDELNAKRAEALSKGDLSAVLPKPGEALTCTIAPNIAGGPMNLSVHGDGQEIKQLVELLTQLSGRPVRDKTGLTGRYDFDMKLDLQAVLAMAQQLGMNIPAAAAANIPQSDGSSLTTALSEQLGMKLESVRAPVTVVVVDSVEAPTTD